MQFAIDETRKKDSDEIRFEPHFKTDRFPLFDHVGVDDDGVLTGWLNMATAREGRVAAFVFGRYGKVELVSQNEKEVIVKRIRG